MTDQSFICGTCGQEHPGLPTDYAFGLPDDVHALRYLERYTRSRSNADLCTLDEERFFIRGVLPVPFESSDEEFVWGLWVEVNREQHDLCVAGYYDDLSDNPRFAARLANTIPGYDDTSDLSVEVQFHSGNDRPSFHFSPTASHQLAREQRDGISRERHHQILERVGFLRTQ